MKDYWRFLREEPELISYGMLLTLLSSFGQTFLISLFVPSIQGHFGLSQAGFGALYSGATLASGLLLPWAGRAIDRRPLPEVTGGVVLLMTGSALALAGAWHVSVLALALVGLRLSGQGLSSHTALTAMARYFPQARGKALSLASLGFPAGEAVLPLTVAGLLALVGWRVSWVLVAVVTALLLPVALVLLRRSGADLDPVGSTIRHDTVSQARAADHRPAGDWSRRHVLRDVRFYLVLPAALLPPFWATGLILYQTSIAGGRGWSLTLMASAFVAYAAARVVSSLVVGGGIDQFSARRLFPYSSLPLGLGVVILALVHSPWAAFAFMALLGTTVGLSGTLKSALWAELYGARHLGAIKGLMASLMVFSTAAAPLLVGTVLELDGGLVVLLLLALLSILLGTGLAFGVHLRPRIQLD
jgi:MFS family permease